MTQKDPVMLFRDATVNPTSECIKTTMGACFYTIYSDMLELISSDFGMTYEWRFYNDGKAWLFKAVQKKKTVFWLSAWNSYFKISFYFNDKTAAGVLQLPINEETKAIFSGIKPVGKLHPLTIVIDHKDQLPELLEIIKYKVNLK